MHLLHHNDMCTHMWNPTWWDFPSRPQHSCTCKIAVMVCFVHTVDDAILDGLKVI